MRSIKAKAFFITALIPAKTNTQPQSVIYQAYCDAIADAALDAQRFVAPFSTQRITWIKPSYLWLMHRSRWAQKSGQKRILRVRISRKGFDKALREGVLTHPEGVSHDVWQKRFRDARVHIQWDTERSLRGAALGHYSIQLGLTQNIIDEYVNEWTLSIEDFTKTTNKISTLLRAGKPEQAKRLLPAERIYKSKHPHGASRSRVLP